MKVIVNEQQPVKHEIKEGMIAIESGPFTYPSHKPIIIFVTKVNEGVLGTSGVVLRNNRGESGGYVASYDKDHFEPFLGTVTLSND